MGRPTDRQPARWAVGRSGVWLILAGVASLLEVFPTTLAASEPPGTSMRIRRHETPADTVSHVRPRLFERRVTFAPEYLSRIYRAAAREREAREALAEKARLASSYAERYGIDETLAAQIVDSALAEGVDPELAFRLVQTESLFRPNARGPQGALGLTQLMPGTARAVDSRLRTESQILDPVTNLRVGFRHLRTLIERYGGDVRLGLLAYNRGEGTVDRALRQGRDPENGYSRRVLGSGQTQYTGGGLLETRP